MDFSKIMDVLDSAKVSFAAVTQHFNTTTSMGRLTLNVLLSFAQFEREVTGERIRDKFAASKKKGIWMGGTIPLGYDVVDRKLVVNKDEAKRVNFIFERYLALGNVTDLVQELDRGRIRNKQWITKKGNRSGGSPFQRGPMYALLQNKIYRGKVEFKGTVYEGEHDAIVAEKLWNAVQEKLLANRKKHSGAKAERKPKLLEGILFDWNGRPLTPTYSVKKGNRRYPYYVSAPFVGYRKNEGEVVRIPAKAIEDLVQDRIETISGRTAINVSTSTLKKTVRRITIYKNIVSAHRWLKELETGVYDSIRALAKAEDIGERYVRKILPLAFLAPDIAESILDGHQPSGFDLKQILERDMPLSWGAQRELLGFE